VERSLEATEGRCGEASVDRGVCGEASVGCRDAVLASIFSAGMSRGIDVAVLGEASLIGDSSVTAEASLSEDAFGIGGISL